MPVYVDNGRLPFKSLVMSHMSSDDDDANQGYPALHSLAQSIGLKRAWFQKDHYDVSQAKRAQAIEAGAVPCDMYFLARLVVKRRRPTGHPPLDLFT